MVVWNLLFSSVLLPLLAIVLLWRRPRQPIAGWIATFVMAGGLAGFSFFAAPWGWFGIPLRFAILALFLLATAYSLARRRDGAEESPVRMLAKGLIGLLFGGVAFGVVKAYEVPPNPLNLSLPVRSGNFLVLHGGSAAPANIHFQEEKTRYSVDLVKLNQYGMRASGIYPKDPREFAMFGVPVFAPCDGVVVAVVDRFDDASIDPKYPLGNMVATRCGTAIVFLGQLQRGSVAVREGTKVTPAVQIARAGNSGASAEPHLHVHAERDGQPVPITFDGRWLVRNATVRR